MDLGLRGIQVIGAALSVLYILAIGPTALAQADGEDVRFEAQVKELRQSICDLQDRDMLVFQIINNAGVINLNGSTSKLTGDKFRKKYQVQSNDYRVILIGKDGGEKMRSHKVISVNEIFNEIDAMPMRQNEMASKQTSFR